MTYIKIQNKLFSEIFFYNLNNNTFKSYKYEESITQYDKVLAIDPNDVDALNNKAFVLADLDRNEEALSIIEKLSVLLLTMNIISQLLHL